MYKVAQMEFRQILTEFQLPNAKKALKSFFFHWLQKTQSLTMMLKISNGFTRRRCKSIKKSSDPSGLRYR
jgi:hypothetical protein